MTFKRMMLARRHIDPAFLALAFAMLVLVVPIAKGIVTVFLAIGVYLALVRHRVRRHAPKTFTIALVAYTFWTVALNALRGAPIVGNREFFYTLIEFSFVFLPLGLCLVPRPLDAMVTGARLGVVGAAILAPIQFLVMGERVGLGSNEAIFAFVIAMGGVISRLEAREPPHFLPNTRLFFYLSILPVVMSETRAAWFVYGPVVLCDAASLLLAARPRIERKRWRMALGAIFVIAAALPMVHVVGQRYQSGVSELSSFEETNNASGSVDVRLAMWRGAMNVLAAHPLIGVGGTRRIEAVAGDASVSPQSGAAIRGYRHLHNLFVDEALTSGLVGLVLLVGVFASFVGSVFAGAPGWRPRETAIAAVFLIATFGSFHGVLLNEWMIMLTFGFMSILLTDMKRGQIAGAASLRPGFDAKGARHGSAA